MQVTSPKGWITMTALGAVAVAAIVWSLIGDIPTIIDSRGILLLQGGLYNVASEEGGTIEGIDVHEGESVKSGQPLMHLSQPDLERRVEIARLDLERLRRTRNSTFPLPERNTQFSPKNVAARRTQLEQAVVGARERIVYLRGNLAHQRDQQHSGLTTPAAIQGIQQKVAQAEANLEVLNSQLAEVSAQEGSLGSDDLSNTITTDSDGAIERAEQEFVLAQQELDRASTIRSPHNARVTNILADEGQHVAAGTDVASIEISGRPLQAYVFVAKDAAEIAVGMPVRIELDGVSKDDFGYLEGRVISCSQLPQSTSELKRLLHNDLFVQEVSQDGAPRLVIARLIADESTPSGYRWTTSLGAETRVTSGRRLMAHIVTQDRRPISYVIPKLRGWVGS